MDIVIMIFHNFPPIISFKHDPSSLPGISGNVRNRKSQSEFIDGKSSHMWGLLYGNPRKMMGA